MKPLVFWFFDNPNVLARWTDIDLDPRIPFRIQVLKGVVSPRMTLRIRSKDGRTIVEIAYDAIRGDPLPELVKSHWRYMSGGMAPDECERWEASLRDSVPQADTPVGAIATLTIDDEMQVDTDVDE